MATKDHPNDRRNFLKGLGYAATSAVVLPAATGVIGNEAEARSLASIFKLDTRFSRRNLDYTIRSAAATVNSRLPVAPPTPNTDELLYSGKIANFAKGLPHNDLGEVNTEAYRKLLTALRSPKREDYESIPMGGTVKLADPHASHAFQLEGLDSHAFDLSPFPAFASQQLAGELVELYWHALARDVPFSQYGQEPQTQAAINDLRRFPEYAGVGADTLFRGSTPGETNGPLLSQFFWLDIPCGTMKLQQRCKLPQAANVHMTDYTEWLAIQRGAAPNGVMSFDPAPHYVRNAHDLAEWVHRDYSYQAFHQTALILMGLQDVRDPHILSGSKTQSPFICFGGPHILDMVAKACYAALKAAWYQKWQVHRSLRPEVLAGRVHNHLRGAARYPLHESLFNSDAVRAVFARHGTYLLPQVYPEGAPTHPSYPSGHAVVAGACVTVLKAFFNEAMMLPETVVASDDGQTLLPYTGSALTVGGELNKLASNVALGRNYAGVHYRQDGLQGLLLGEKVALHLLLESKPLFNQPGMDFTLTRFDGQTLTI